MNSSPCPECGSEGPHPIVEESDDRHTLTVECSSCYCEFRVEE